MQKITFELPFFSSEDIVLFRRHGRTVIDTLVRVRRELVPGLIIAILIAIWDIPATANTHTILAALGSSVAFFILATLVVIVLDHPVSRDYLTRFACGTREFRSEMILFVILSSIVILWGWNGYAILYLQTVYIATVSLFHDTAYTRMMRRALRDIIRMPAVAVLNVVVIGLFLTWWGFPALGWIAVTVIFLMFRLYGWDHRVTAGGAIACIIITLIFVMIGAEDAAEDFAIGAFSLIIITTALVSTDMLYERIAGFFARRKHKKEKTPKIDEPVETMNIQKEEPTSASSEINS